MYKHINWNQLLCAIILSMLLLSACKPEEPPGDLTSATLPSALGTPPFALATPPFALATPFGIPNYIVDILGHNRHYFIPGGLFLYGSSEEGDKLARGDELPQKEVRVPGYWIMGNEVTNGDYIKCEDAGICTPPETSKEGPLSYYRNSKYDDYPVIGVSWYQAEYFCEWIEARLPTEVEWEKAARGEFGNIYPWGFDAPSCDLLNMHGCSEEPGPVAVGSYPGGVSPYGIYDMSGNVRDWVFDWYAPDTYKSISLYNPAGPDEGKLKVVRGGGWKDFEENLRTSARAAYPPDSTHDDVGFRCVPVTESYAPFCPPEFTPLCRNPYIPPRDEPCIPGEGIPGEEGVTINSFGCPLNGLVTIRFDTGGGDNQGYSAVVGGEQFTCRPSALGENLVECTGPAPTMGSNVNINICKGGGSQNNQPPITHQTSWFGNISLVSFIENSPLLAMMNIAKNCPDGYDFDEQTGACVRQTEDNCPTGWLLSALIKCEPEDENACPDSTKFNANTGGCEPEEEKECPEGYYLSKKNTCEPEQNREGLCPPGYFYNRKTECCQPLKGDNFGCTEGYYFDKKYQLCLPLDGNNCGYGSVYNGYDSCLKKPYQPELETPPEGQCPPNLLTSLTPNTCDPTSDYYNEGKPDPSRITRPGDLLDPSGRIITHEDPNHPANCGPNGQYLAALNNCFETDENGCPPNYYWHEKYQRCVPTNGPGSPCPPNYIFNAKLQCCVPTPGHEGARCLNTEPTIIGDSGAQLPGAPGQPLEANGSGVGNVAAVGQYAITIFDPQQGISDEDTTRDGGQPVCPPSYFSANTGNCTYSEDLETGEGRPNGEPPGGFTANTCPPGYWDEKNNKCSYTPPQCEPYEYFSYRLGYCVPLQDDCCPIGQDFTQNFKRCMPVRQHERERKEGEPCAEGYESVQGKCLLIGRTEGQGMCWTIIVNVPVCVGRCKVGYVYNENTGRCEKPSEEKPSEPSDQCANINCAGYTDSEECERHYNCCFWYKFLVQSGGECRPNE